MAKRTGTATSSSPADRLAERFVASPEPPMAPDGGPMLPMAIPERVIDLSDWVCLRGPCRHYHRMTSTIDAETPKDGSTHYAPTEAQLAAGQTVGDPVAQGTQTLHTCYVAPGVMWEMENEIVTDCNLWDPLDLKSPEQVALASRRAAYDKRAAKEAAAERAEMDRMLAAAELEQADTLPDAPGPRRRRGLKK